VRQGQAQAAFAGLEVLDPDGGELGAAERAGEADQQQRAVAQSGQGGFDRRQDLAQDVGGSGEFLTGQLAGIGGGAVHAGQGCLPGWALGRVPGPAASLSSFLNRNPKDLPFSIACVAPSSR
jgi:hypothetical protein